MSYVHWQRIRLRASYYEVPVDITLVTDLRQPLLFLVIQPENQPKEFTAIDA